MYGMVNKAVEELICSKFGEEAWEAIKPRANVDVDVFISNDPSPDKMTYSLVEAAAEVLGVTARDLLLAFGEHWILETARMGYGDLMQASGKSLPEFLTHLPHFHTRVAMIFPELSPPRFTISNRSKNSLHRHYLTHRPGLTDFVVGLVNGLAKKFNTATRISILEEKNNGADHDVFLVEWDTVAAS